MRTRPPLRALLATAALGLSAVVQMSPSYADGGAPSAATCIKAHPEARYRGFGYNHIVHLENVCAVAAECDVSTDVNPEKQHTSVAPHDVVEVTTFLGSPARVFVPHVACTMQKT